jgi:hypothetical protein
VTTDRRALRAALLEAEPWLGTSELGPQAVVAGRCDRCDQAPRLLPLCGPTSFEAVCRDCAELLGDDGWCDGHLEEGRAARRWARGLPDRWHEAVVLWWAATGEIGLDERPGGGRDA